MYPVNPDRADDELVESIRYPADDQPGLAPPGQIPEVRLPRGHLCETATWRLL